MIYSIFSTGAMLLSFSGRKASSPLSVTSNFIFPYPSSSTLFIFPHGAVLPPFASDFITILLSAGHASAMA